MQASIWNILRDKLIQINEDITEDNVDDFISSLRREFSYENLLDGNQNFLDILRKGKKFTVSEKGSKERKYIKLIDFEDIENNRFTAVNQLTFRQKETIRPDIALFINGIPIVLGEIKSRAQEKDCSDAIEDLQEYEEVAKRLFMPSLFNVAVDSLDYRYGATGAPKGHYYPWKESDERYEHIDNEVKKAVHSMLNHETLLDILKYFVFYGEREGRTIKIIPRYMQYYAANKIIDRIKDEKYKSGLIWHTQGSGKSYTMFFTAYKIMHTNPVKNPRPIIIVDRDSLNEQMMKDLNKIDFPNFQVAERIDHLEEMLEQEASRTILTTIQKFQDVDVRREEENFIILSDEAHRFLEKELGSKLEYSLPNAYHFGFTGTPVRERDRDTFNLFMPRGKEELYLHRYSIADGIEDNLILPVHFEIKDVIWDLDEEKLEELDIEFEDKFSDLSIEEKNKIVREYVNKSELAELRPRAKEVVRKINEHYEENFGSTKYKAMVVTPSRRAAAIYKEEMDKQRDPNESKVVYSGGATSSDIVRQYMKTNEEIDRIIERFEDPDEDPKILIVCDMLLTGFDAPILKVMYLDRPLKNHSLLQAIARTNRPRDGKYNGLIVDFQRVFENLDEALDYPQEIRKRAAIDSEKLKEEFANTLDETMELFASVSIENTQESVDECVNLLTKNPERRKNFKEKYRKLQDLYETISPDEFLAKDDINKKYKILSQIYIVYKRRQSRDENPEDGVREETKKLIEDYIDVEGIKEDYPVYEISKEHLERIKDLKPAAKAAEIAYATQKHIKGKIDRNPRYVSISTRLKEIVDDWQNRDLEDQIAAEKLEEVEKEALNVESGPEKLGMTEGEYAVLSVLEDEYSSVLGVESDTEDDTAISKSKSKTIEDLARQIGEAFGKVDKSFPGWEENEAVIKEIRKNIIDVLYRDDNIDVESTNDMITNTDFLDEAIEYLIENERYA